MERNDGHHLIKLPLMAELLYWNYIYFNKRRVWLWDEPTPGIHFSFFKAAESNKYVSFLTESTGQHYPKEREITKAPSQLPLPALATRIKKTQRFITFHFWQAWPSNSALSCYFPCHMKSGPPKSNFHSWFLLACWFRGGALAPDCSKVRTHWGEGTWGLSKN